MCSQASKALNRQLALAFEPTDECGFDYFCWGENTLLQDHLLNTFRSTDNESFFYIWGQEGVGKSHLLQACCLAIQPPYTAVYLPLKTLHTWGNSILEGIEHQSLIAIDDIETIAGDPAWEEALFHLINTVRQDNQKKIIISSCESPSHSSIHLADLKSRLHWGLASHLLALNDQQKVETLQFYAKKRGFHLPARVAEFLIQRFDRNMHNLIQLLKTLDHASLAAQRKITLPFVKQALNLS
ncbi:MAG: DnaA regulatory inactivator Hda [Gammaproteobacteria bacterium]|nr:DnaA regulatory inactivator Hda [Gammaproteobacteria bacterium]